MKKAYVKPVMECETFAPDEYIAACCRLYCYIPDGEPYGYHRHDDDPGTAWGNEDHQLHGTCKNGSYYNPDRSEEIGKGSIVSDLSLNGIAISTADQLAQYTPGQAYELARWISVDVNGTGRYIHYGKMVPDSNPNAS